jgi:hypothetical protein
MWHGTGVLTHEGYMANGDGYTYRGEWRKGKRNGKGIQVNQKKVALENGYLAYKGNWQDDMRHGRGEVVFSTGSGAEAQKMLHEGSFHRGRREGKCDLYFLVSDKKKLGKLVRALPTMTYSEDKYVNNQTVSSAIQSGTSSDDVYYKLFYFSGVFENDRMPKNKKCWLHLVNPSEGVMTGYFYYGMVTEDGTRQGDGTLYASQAGDDDFFMECVRAARPYVKESQACDAFRLQDPGLLRCPTEVPDMNHLKYLLYDGEWHQNLPHGVGVQFYPEVSKNVGGVYYGDFKNGLRHGRGTWEVRDRSFVYRPLRKQRAVDNWKDDLMHGIANVEDSKYHHDNVVYSDNKTLMPFTTVGPPKTQFDYAPGWKLVSKGVRIIGRTQKQRQMRKARPKTTHAKSHDTKVMQTVVEHGAVTEKFKGEDGEVQNLLKEPTEVLPIEDDMLVLGGTGGNAVMNGFYFKVTKSFGHNLWRMAKKESGTLGLWTSYNQRYIYNEDDKKIVKEDEKSSSKEEDKEPFKRTWYIGPEPLAGAAGLKKEAGCAYAEEMCSDEKESAPCTVKSGWAIYTPSTKTFVSPQGEDTAERQEGEKSLVDTLTVQAIVGFKIVDKDMPELNNRLFRRFGCEFYERPVYENEARVPEESNLFLYWFKYSGNHKDGMSAGDGVNGPRATDIVDASEIFQTGCWVVSSKLGAGPSIFYGGAEEDQEYLIAYVGDRAASPYGIAEEALWWVRNERSDRWFGSPWVMRPLQLEYQPLEEDEMMDYFDTSDEEGLNDK